MKQRILVICRSWTIRREFLAPFVQLHAICNEGKGEFSQLSSNHRNSNAPQRFEISTPRRSEEWECKNIVDRKVSKINLPYLSLSQALSVQRYTWVSALFVMLDYSVVCWLIPAVKSKSRQNIDCHIQHEIRIDNPHWSSSRTEKWVWCIEHLATAIEIWSLRLIFIMRRDPRFTFGAGIVFRRLKSWSRFFPDTSELTLRIR